MKTLEKMRLMIFMAVLFGSFGIAILIDAIQSGKVHPSILLVIFVGICLVMLVKSFVKAIRA